MQRRSVRLAAAAVVVATAASAHTAFACWDGYAATVGHMSIQTAMGGPVTWNPTDAHVATLWAKRIDALLPPGVDLTFNGSIVCSGERCPPDTAWNLPFDASYGEVFLAVANAFGATAAQRGAALQLEFPLYTVQVFAGTKAGALALRDRMNGMDLGTIADGVFEEGGFPSYNPPVHAIADADDPTLFRVVVEEYGDLATAKAAQAELLKAGIRGFVTFLPLGTPADESTHGR